MAVPPARCGIRGQPALPVNMAQKGGFPGNQVLSILCTGVADRTDLSTDT